MKLWQRLGLLTLFVLLVGGVRFYFLWKERNAPTAQTEQRQRRRLSDDDVVVPRKMLIDDLKSAKALIGKPVWIAAGYQLDYYPFTALHVEFAHPAGLLPTTEKLQIAGVVMQRAPPNLASRIPHGNQQVFIVFTLPNDIKKASASYATAIGYLAGADIRFYCDDIFYYDDPHQMYQHWPPDIWQAIDQHQPKTGMNELQVSMALGQVQTSDSSTYGNRTVHYDVAGKPWTVSFEHNHATEIKAE